MVARHDGESLTGMSMGPGFKFMDIEASALEGGLGERLYASVVAVVMVFLLGRLHGEEWAASIPSVGNSSVKKTPKSCSGGHARGK